MIQKFSFFNHVTNKVGKIEKLRNKILQHPVPACLLPLSVVVSRRILEYWVLSPSHFFGVQFLEKEDLIFGNIASIVRNGQKILISNYGCNISKNEIFLFQKCISKKVCGISIYANSGFFGFCGHWILAKLQILILQPSLREKEREFLCRLILFSLSRSFEETDPIL